MLAEVEDVERFLGRVIPAADRNNVEALLAKLSELFRSAAGGRQFTPGESTNRLKVTAGCVWLPQTPVQEILSVVDDKARPVPYRVLGRILEVPLPSDRFVTVNYTHGGVIPPLVVSTIADAAARILKAQENTPVGVSQETDSAGVFSRTRSYAVWAQIGSVTLTPEEQQIAARYRGQTPKHWVMQP